MHNAWENCLKKKMFVGTVLCVAEKNGNECRRTEICGCKLNINLEIYMYYLSMKSKLSI